MQEGVRGADPIEGIDIRVSAFIRGLSAASRLDRGCNEAFLAMRHPGSVGPFPRRVRGRGGAFRVLLDGRRRIEVEIPDVRLGDYCN